MTNEVTRGEMVAILGDIMSGFSPTFEAAAAVINMVTTCESFMVPNFYLRRSINQMSEIDNTLKERGSRYGEFKEHASYSQRMKEVMQMNNQKWHRLAYYQKEALEMIAHKIGRIINGDPDYDDSWRDICGYSQLVLDRLSKVEK